MKKIMKLVCYSCIFIATAAAASAPAYKAKMSLKFDAKPVCLLKSAKGKETQGQAALKHDEDTISWQASCEIKLPDDASYCVLSKQKVNAPGDMVFYTSGVSKGKIAAKIVSDADINPEYAEFTVIYLCFK